MVLRKRETDHELMQPSRFSAVQHTLVVNSFARETHVDLNGLHRLGFATEDAVLILLVAARGALSKGLHGRYRRSRSHRHAKQRQPQQHGLQRLGRETRRSVTIVYKI